MPVSCHGAILYLKQAYSELGWFQKLFFPSQLAFELARYPEQNPTNQDQFAVFKAFEKNTWFFQKWLFPSLQRFDGFRFTDTFRDLSASGLFTGDAAHDNFNAVVAHQNPYDVRLAIKFLSITGLLRGHAGQANFNAVVAQPHLNNVGVVLRALYYAGHLNTGFFRGTAAAQANLTALVITHAAILLHPNNINQDGLSIWYMIPYQRPTAAEFEAMLVIAQTYAGNPDAGSVALLDYVYTHLLDMNPRQPVFNPNQSTHTASVHASVSQSAEKLLTRYDSKIIGGALDAQLQKFASSVETHTPRDSKQRAAARCIRRLTSPNYSYTDSVSQVSLKQLMGLVWIAIHDETARIGTLSDAKQQLIEGFYEIQRGYNLSEAGVDDNAFADRPICTAGTFNKLCEKLAGLHRDVSILYITKTGATAKLRIVAVEEAQIYLNTLVFGTDEFVALQKSINNDTMQPLWDIIAPQVANRLFDEFGSLYPDGITSPDFVDCVAQGIYALTTDRLVLPTASMNQTSVANNPHVLFQPHDSAELGVNPSRATLSASNR